jgi:alpha-L-arabinofuranosidase
LAEAAYMTTLERNVDIVSMASYAPLLARRNNTSWNPNLIYFTNTAILPTVNYYVQQLFSVNHGDVYFSKVISSSLPDTAKTFAASCVKNTLTGDVIIKLVNTDSASVKTKINLSAFRSLNPAATVTVLSGDPLAENSFEQPQNIIPEASTFTIGKSFAYNVPAHSLTVISIKTKKAK